MNIRPSLILTQFWNLLKQVLCNENYYYSAFYRSFEGKTWNIRISKIRFSRIVKNPELFENILFKIRFLERNENFDSNESFEKKFVLKSWFIRKSFIAWIVRKPKIWFRRNFFWIIHESYSINHSNLIKKE